MNYDMVVFGEDWGSHPSSTQHLMRHLMPEHQILWVNSLGLRRPHLCRRDLLRAMQKLGAMFRPSPAGMTLSNDGPVQLNPKVVPLPAQQWARTLNACLLKRMITPHIREQAQAPILWTSLPSAVGVIGHLRTRATVYYCGDDFSALAGVDHAPVAEMEQELADKADLIIVSSEVLKAKFPSAKTRVLPHGVDFERFAMPVSRAPEISGCGPVAGFYGAIAEWFDQALMIAVARRLRHWRFVLIGPAQCDISALLAEPNIHWLGPKPHGQLPHFSQHWNVGLLPFRHNRQIEACNPLKLREYLAAGQPVVSTDFPALAEYRDFIHITNTVDGFCRAIEASQTDTVASKMTRQLRVAQESWRDRSRELTHLLSAL